MPTEQAGQWKELRSRALDLMRGRVRTGEYRRVRLGELISVLLHEDLADEAWSTAADYPEQVSESQWLQLITLRERRHPADVLGPLARLIELGVEQVGDKYRYPKAVKALKRLRDDYERAGDAPGLARTKTACGSGSGGSTRSSLSWMRRSACKAVRRHDRWFASAAAVPSRPRSGT